MKKIISHVAAAAFLLCVAAHAKEYAVESPSGILTVTVGAEPGGRLVWRLSRGEMSIINRSPLGIIVDGADLGIVSDITETERRSIDTTHPAREVHSIATDRCNVAVFRASPATGAAELTLTFRVYDDGAAFRYTVSGEGARRINGEATAWSVPAEYDAWYQDNLVNYEGEFKKMSIGKIKTGSRLGVPVTLELPGGEGYAVITEGALFDYSGMSLISTDGALRAEFIDDPDGWTSKGKIVSPWRITIFAPDLNGLYNSDIVWNVNEPPPPKLAGAAWIRPGRSLWSWLNGARNSVTPENMRFYIDAAQQLGYEYILIDEGWETNSPLEDPDKGWGATLNEQLAKVAELVDYARARGVGVWVWKHHFMLKIPSYRKDFFSKLHKIGVVGIKIDFMDSESKDTIDFYEDALRDAAKYELMVNFHGANKPTGESRRYPNEVAREGVRGLEYRSLFPDYNCTLPFTRYIAGHGDYTPMHFNKEWMSITSWPHQIATGIIFQTFVTFFGGRPQDYLDSPARDLIEKLPTTWDETIVLPDSRIGRLAAFARRKGDTWFVAILNGGGGREIKLPLDFLNAGKFKVVAFFDVMNEPLAMRKKEGFVTHMDTIPVRMRTGGGFAAMITPAE